MTQRGQSCRGAADTLSLQEVSNDLDFATKVGLVNMKSVIRDLADVKMLEMGFWLP